MAQSDTSLRFKTFSLGPASQPGLTPGSIQTEVLSVDDAGALAGYYYDSSSKQHGFLYSGGAFVEIDAPNGTFTQVTSINRRDQIAGYYISGGLDEGFERLTGEVPGTKGTFLHGIDNAAQIVDDYRDVEENQFGFVIGPPTHHKELIVYYFCVHYLTETYPRSARIALQYLNLIVECWCLL